MSECPRRSSPSHRDLELEVYGLVVLTCSWRSVVLWSLPAAGGMWSLPAAGGLWSLPAAGGLWSLPAAGGLWSCGPYLQLEWMQHESEKEVVAGQQLREFKSLVMDGIAEEDGEMSVERKVERQLERIQLERREQGKGGQQDQRCHQDQGCRQDQGCHQDQGCQLECQKGHQDLTLECGLVLMASNQSYKACITAEITDCE